MNDRQTTTTGTTTPVAVTALATLLNMLESDHPAVSHFARVIKESVGTHASWMTMVRAFHTVYNMPITSPADATKTLRHMSPERLELRMALIAEEFEELCEACGFIVKTKGSKWVFIPTGDKPDIFKIADALGDLIYVVIGFALEAGIDLHAVMREIQASNMTKMGADGLPIFRADGKLLKGPWYHEPVLERIMMVAGDYLFAHHDDAQAGEA
jgi:predicted HAD superfamily Cof-like phosphohydrolase